MSHSRYCDSIAVTVFVAVSVVWYNKTKVSMCLLFPVGRVNWRV